MDIIGVFRQEEHVPLSGNLVIDQLLVPSFVLFFLIGGVTAALVGVGLIVNSAGMLRMFDIINYSVSTRRLGKPLAIPRDSSRYVWRHHRWLGTLFALGAAYSIYGLAAHVNDAAFASALNLKLPPLFVLWVVESSRLILIVSCMVALVASILLGFFPETMRVIDQRASRWYSTRRLLPEADLSHLSLDRWVAAFPRASGCLILVPALAVVGYFAPLMMK